MRRTLFWFGLTNIVQAVAAAMNISILNIKILLGLIKISLFYFISVDIIEKEFKQLLVLYLMYELNKKVSKRSKKVIFSEQ